MDDDGGPREGALRALAGDENTRVEIEAAALGEDIAGALPRQRDDGAAVGDVGDRRVVASQGFFEAWPKRRLFPGRRRDQPLVGAEPQHAAYAVTGNGVGRRRRRHAEDLRGPSKSIAGGAQIDLSRVAALSQRHRRCARSATAAGAPPIRQGALAQRRVKH